MKKLLLSLIFFFLILPSSAAAKDFNFSYVVSGRTVTAKVVTTGYSATATITDPITSGSIQRSLNAWTTKTTNSHTGAVSRSPDKTLQFTKDTQTQVMTFSNLSPGATYYLTDNSYVGDFAFTTEQPSTNTANSVAVTLNPLIIDVSGASAVASGKINTDKHPDFKSFKIVLYLSQHPFEGTDATSAIGTTDSLKYDSKADRDAKTGGINKDGTYYFVFRVDPSAHYFYKQVIETPAGVGVIGGDFTATDGVKSSGVDSKELTFDQRSYRLLAPWPGLAVLLDPDLCQEQKNNGQGQICDFNDFIQYGFKIAIGIVALLLVFRIMLEGYKYMVSDVPALRVSAKGNIMEALMGLLLALSSYVILNTINPKLVASNIQLDTINVAILEDEEDSEPTTTLGTGSIPKGSVGACTTGVATVNTAGGNFIACKSITAPFQKMIADAYKDGYKISGGGFRTYARQVQLREANCGIGKAFDSHAVCTPPTAFPGKSRHESGLAFDLTCEGNLIRAQDNKCFVWLKGHAAAAGLKNFAKEPWHWSIDGR
jgi:hypothetical protein